jgi:hypothetical protein
LASTPRRRGALSIRSKEIPVKLRRKIASIAAAGAVGLGVVAVPTPASALSRTCSLNGVAWTHSICWTAGVPASSGGWIDIYIGTYSGCALDYRVVDGVTRVDIAYGRVRGDYSRRIYGLTNHYELMIKKVGLTCGGDAIIDNV